MDHIIVDMTIDMADGRNMMFSGVSYSMVDLCFTCEQATSTLFENDDQICTFENADELCNDGINDNCNLETCICSISNLQLI